MNVSKSGYYKWLQGKLSERAKRKKIVTQLVKQVFYNHYEIFGYRKVHAFVKETYNVSPDYVRNIMKNEGLKTIITKRYKRYSRSPIATIPNTLNRQFETLKHIVVTDMTQIRHKGRWVYISAAVNLKNHRVVGIQSSYRPNTELVLETLDDALNRMKYVTMLHSDQGSVYQSKDIALFCQRHDIEQSMSRRGCPYDNAVIESFFSSLKRERLNFRTYDTLQELQTDIEDYAYQFYNKIRPHQSLRYLSPFEYSKQMNLFY